MLRLDAMSFAKYCTHHKSQPSLKTVHLQFQLEPKLLRAKTSDSEWTMYLERRRYPCYSSTHANPDDRPFTKYMSGFNRKKYSAQLFLLIITNVLHMTIRQLDTERLFKFRHNHIRTDPWPMSLIASTCSRQGRRLRLDRMWFHAFSHCH